MIERHIIKLCEPSLGEEEWHAIHEPLSSGWVMQGPKVAEFERQFAARHEAKHAIATSSCTTALHLALAAMDIGPGDEVIVPAFTWVATANAVLYCGATPVFVDIERDTYNIDASQIRAWVTPRTKAVIAVHLFGLCADVNAIARAAPRVPIVEDAACAAGSSYCGRPAGSLGVVAAFSFHPRKSITTGEGGMVTTNDDALAERMRALRNHGICLSKTAQAETAPYCMPDIRHLGYNYRMTDLQGAIGLVQLGKLDKLIAERRRWADYYRRALSDVSWLQLPTMPDDCRHSWQSFVCYVDERRWSRNEVMSQLHALGISTRPGTHSVPMLDYYRRRFNFQPKDFPLARDCELQTMAIPLHNRMTDRDYKRVVEAIRGLG